MGTYKNNWRESQMIIVEGQVWLKIKVTRDLRSIA